LHREHGGAAAKLVAVFECHAFQLPSAARRSKLRRSAASEDDWQTLGNDATLDACAWGLKPVTFGGETQLFGVQ